MIIRCITCVFCHEKWFRTILDAPGPSDSGASQANVTLIVMPADGFASYVWINPKMEC